MKHTLLFLITFLLLLAPGCAPEIDPPVPSAGSLDFSAFISLGSSGVAGITDSRIPFESGAGIPDGGYFEKGVSLSFPSILARQFATAQVTPFFQPYLSGDGAGYAALLGFKPASCDRAPATPIYRSHTPAAGWEQNISDRGPYHNMGVPHLEAKEMRDAEALVCNPYASRMLSGQAQADSVTYLSWVSGSNPTFFALWLGLEDVLHYALFGGRNRDFPLTEPDIFEEEVRLLLQGIMDDEKTKGVLLNVPDITRFPFFTTIGTHRYDEYCQEKPLYIQRGGSQEGVPSGVGDKILLSALRMIENQGNGLRPNDPLNDKFVLDSQEVAMIQEYTKAYNLALERIVASYNQQGARIALVDMHGFYQQIFEGIQTHGMRIDAQYLDGGFFSLDGLYPTGRGNAMIANEVIESMNEFFPGVNLPPADITRFPGVAFP